MDQTPQTEKTTGMLRSWIIVIAIAIVFIVWGLFIFFTIGDKGPPPWDFGVIRDVPGESPYSTERPSK